MYTKQETEFGEQEFDECIYCGYLTIRSIKLPIPRDIVSSFMDAPFEGHKVLVLVLVLVLAVVDFGIDTGNMSHHVNKELLGVVI